jgi:hypothetical protein
LAGDELPQSIVGTPTARVGGIAGSAYSPNFLATAIINSPEYLKRMRTFLFFPLFVFRDFFKTNRV